MRNKKIFMPGFLTRKIITTETLGEKLKKVREGKDLSLEDVAKKINIQVKYLTALENGEYHYLPGEAYIKGFLFNYAKFLGINQGLIARLYEKEKFTPHDKVFYPVKKIKKSIILPRVLKRVFQFLIIFFILFYLAWGIKKNIFPPYLTIINPNDNLIIKENSVKIVGQTEKGVTVKVNDKLVISNFEGKFEQIIDLKPGLNIIKISAFKKYSREKVIIRRVININNENNYD